MFDDVIKVGMLYRVIVPAEETYSTVGILKFQGFKIVKIDLFDGLEKRRVMNIGDLKQLILAKFKLAMIMYYVPEYEEGDADENSK